MAAGGRPSISFQIPGFDQYSSLSGAAAGEDDTEVPNDDSLTSWLARGEELAQTRKRRREGDRSFTTQNRVDVAPEQEDEDDAGQELTLPWNCLGCTYLNASERISCEVCGKVNRRRERLKEKGAEERHRQLTKMMHERQTVLDGLKDLDDLGDDCDEGHEDMDVGEVSGSGAAHHGHTSLEASTSSVPYSGLQASIESFKSVQEEALPRYQLPEGSCPLRRCHSDLLLHCLTFLANAEDYCRLRCVCKAWSSLAEHEALWRPLAQAVWRASIAKARAKGRSSSRGEGPLKGEATPQPPIHKQQQQSHQTPAPPPPQPQQQQQAPQAPERWRCRVCGLLQADPFGLHCEFCSAIRDIVTSPAAAPLPPPAALEEEPALFRKVASYKELAEVWATTRRPSLGSADGVMTEAAGAAAAVGTSGHITGGSPVKRTPSERPLWSEDERKRADAAAAERSEAGRLHVAGVTEENRWRVAEATGEWFMAHKAATMDTVLAAQWETLHRGWEWLVNATRTALRTRLCSNQEQINALNDSCLPITESFQKVVNKLTKRDWVMLWDCMRAEFHHQAEALRRDMQRQWRAQRVWELTPLRCYRAFLKDLLHVFEVWQAWVFEIDGFFGRLNDQICGERYRATTSSLPGCGVMGEVNTPYVGEASLLAFRDCVVMHPAVRGPLLGSVEGDETLSLATMFAAEGSVRGPKGAAAAAVPARRIGGRQQQEEDVEAMMLLEAEGEGEEDAAGRLREFSESSRVGRKRPRSSSSTSSRIVENLADLLEPLSKMVSELDVADDPLRGGPGQSGREAFRRAVLRPVMDSVAELRLDGKVALSEDQAGTQQGVAVMEQQGWWGSEGKGGRPHHKRRKVGWGDVKGAGPGGGAGRLSFS